MNNNCLGLSGHLVGVFPFTEWFMDHLINFMNNNRSLSLPLFLFLLIKTPSPSHIHFSLHVLKFNYNQKEFFIEAV